MPQRCTAFFGMGRTVYRKMRPNGVQLFRAHAARAMRHLNLYRAGDRKDTHLINAAMRCMMAYATEKARGEGQA